MFWDRRGSLWLSAGCLAYAALVACSGGAFSSTPGGAAGDKDTGGTDANGATAGKTTAGTQSDAGSGHGGASGGRPAGGGSGGSTAGVTSAGAGGKPITVGGASPTGGGGAGGSGPDTPAIPKDGLYLWFKADVGFTESSSGSIWEDQSGNKLNATQALAEFSPTLVTSQDLPLPVVQFDGTNDLLELPQLEVPVDTGGLSIFAVAGRGVDSYCSAVIELSNGPEIDDINLGSLDETFQYEVFTDSVTAQDNAFPVAQMRLLEVLHSTTDPDKPLAELRINGTLTASKAIPAPAKITRSTNFIGHTLYGDCLSTYSGAMAEIIFYSRKLTAAERVVVEKYLMSKWAL
jgi:hypothetical protein